MPNEYGRRPVTRTRMDSLANALAGWSGRQDRTIQNVYLYEPMHIDQELTSAYLGGGLARKIVSCRPDDMLRAWITFPDDTDGKLLQALDRLEIRTHLKTLLTWTELYRGAVMVLGGIDGGNMEAMLNEKGTKGIQFIRVYPAPVIQNTEIDLNQDSGSRYFEDVEHWRIQRRYAMSGANEFKVHTSRCIVSKGIPVPDDKDNVVEWTYRYFGMGRLQAVFQQMANSDSAQKAFGNLITEATVAVQKIPGLEAILAGADDAKGQLESVMNTIATMKSVLNMLLLPEGGEFKRDSLSMSGWRDVAMVFREELAAVAEIPVPRLYGIPSAGLGGGGSDSEASKNYDVSIQADQEIKLRPIIQRIVRYVAPTVGMDPEIPFEFRPLSMPSEKEMAETRKTVAETDKLYVDMGALDAVDEVRQSRFGGSKWTMDTSLDPNTDLGDEDPMDAQIKELEARINNGTKVPAIPVPKMSKPKVTK